MDSSHIEQREYLSQFPQISTLIFHILSVAQAGDLPERAAQKTYKQILDGYSKLDGEAFWLFRDELIRILVTPDSHFGAGGDLSGLQIPGRN